MPATIKRLTKRGLVDLEKGAFNLQDAAKHEPRAGVYTVGNTHCRTKVLLIDAHLDRLEDSAERLGVLLDYDRERLRDALRKMITEANYGDVRFRISVPLAAPDEILLSIEPYQQPSPLLIESGARCITSSTERRNPASKSSEWMHRRRALEKAQPDGVYETFLLDPCGNLLEGASSNVYVLQDRELYTASAGVLAGVSRMIVMQVCRNLVSLRLEAPNIDDIDDFDEVFLSSSSRGIIPVVEIDGAAIGDGRVGATTLALRHVYQRWVDEHLEEL